MANLQNTKITRRLAYLALFAGLMATVVLVCRGAGRWLVRQDPLSSADVIVVLSGSLPQRAEEAGRIFKMGAAPEVWVTRPESPAEELQRFGIRYVGEEEYSREILISDGVPASSVHILPDTVVNTEQEVEEIATQMHTTGKTRVIIVTSPQHTRRVRALWDRLAGNEYRATIRAASTEQFDQDHWWRNTRDALAVVREILGLANVWTGLRVRPHSR